MSTMKLEKSSGLSWGMMFISLLLLAGIIYLTAQIIGAIPSFHQAPVSELTVNLNPDNPFADLSFDPGGNPEVTQQIISAAEAAVTTLAIKSLRDAAGEGIKIANGYNAEDVTLQTVISLYRNARDCKNFSNFQRMIFASTALQLSIMLAKKSPDVISMTGAVNGLLSLFWCKSDCNGRNNKWWNEFLNHFPSLNLPKMGEINCDQFQPAF